MARQKNTGNYFSGFLLIFLTVVLLVSFFSHHMTKAKIFPSPTPHVEKPFVMYHAPSIPKKAFYTIVMVGDSMTAALGIHGGNLSDMLNSLYQSSQGDQRILIDNYAQGSTNILELHNQMTSTITTGDAVFAPLVSRQFDLILIESFGYNPLSEFPLSVGLAKQTQVLQQVMQLLTNRHPQPAVIFVATIAPNKETYAREEIPGISVADRTVEAQERMAYIQNHINFAKTHNIPIIDIFDDSLVGNDGNLAYINPTDHIHPSFAGVDFIDGHIANFIFDNKILPK